MASPTGFQTYLWKVAATLKEVILANGSFSEIAQFASQYNFTTLNKNSLTTCIPMPYLFLVGKFTYEKGIRCFNCRLYSYINVSIEFNCTFDSIMIIQQGLYIWLPINLRRHCSPDPLNHVFIEFFNNLLK